MGVRTDFLVRSAFCSCVFVVLLVIPPGVAGAEFVAHPGRLIGYQLYSLPYEAEPVNVFDTIPVRLELNENRREGLEYIQPTQNCHIPFAQAMGFEDPLLEVVRIGAGTSQRYAYVYPAGEEVVHFEISLIGGDARRFPDIEDEPALVNRCNVNFIYDTQTDQRVENTYMARFNVHPYDFGTVVPDGYEESTRNGFTKAYSLEREDGSRNSIRMELRQGRFYSYDELLEFPHYSARRNADGYTLERMSFTLGEGYIYYKCDERNSFSERSQAGHHMVTCNFDGIVLTPIAPVTIIYSDTHRVDFEGEENIASAQNEVNRKENEFKDAMVTMLNEVYFESGGDTLAWEWETAVEEPEEEREIARRTFELSFRNRESDTIWNRGRVSGEDPDHLVILTNIDGKAFDEDGREIRVSEQELFSGIRLVARIESNHSQIGIGANQRDELTRSVTRSLETIEIWGKGPRRYEGFYTPTEYLNVHLEYDGERVSNQLTYTVHVKDASPRIILTNPIIDVQDGERRVIEFRVEDDDQSELRCSLTIPSGFARQRGVPNAYLTYNNEDTTLVELDCADGDTVQVVFNAPNLGNFDLNNELNALNMWRYQEDTMKTLAQDLIGVGVDSRLEYLNEQRSLLEAAGSLEQAQQYADAFEALDRANKLSGTANKIINVVELPSDVVESTRDHLQSATDVGERTASGQQGWVEWGADWGVYGIDLAQTTVGVISKAPQRIPVLGPLGKRIGSGFSTSFNLMTNVWKGNFEYLANVERINRAEEMKFPYPVIITIEDEDGFVTKEVQNMMVVYSWLN